MPTRSVRVLVVMEAWEVTGTAKSLLNFCATASNHDNQGGAKITVVSFSRYDRREMVGDGLVPFQRAVREAGIGLDIIEERYRFDPRVLSKLRHVVERRNPDIVQTSGVKSHFLVRASGINQRVPWIAYHHGYTTENFKMRVYNQLDRWSLLSADKVVTVCAPFARLLARRGVSEERIEVVPNAIEGPPPATEQEVAALRQQFGLRQGERVILTVGRLSTEKGRADLILAAKHLVKRRPGLSFKIVVVGGGPERRRLEFAAHSSELEKRVVFAGYQSRVGPFYRLADVFALPSHSEGSAHALLEAMAAGTPIVATAVGGVPETVDNEESALVVPPRRPADLADAAARLLDDRGLAARLASNAKTAVAARFTQEGYRDALLAIYRGLCRTEPSVKTEK